MTSGRYNVGRNDTWTKIFSIYELSDCKETDKKADKNEKAGVCVHEFRMHNWG